MLPLTKIITFLVLAEVINLENVQFMNASDNAGVLEYLFDISNRNTLML